MRSPLADPSGRPFGLAPAELALLAGLAGQVDSPRIRGLDREGWRAVAQLALTTFTAPLLYSRLRRGGGLGLLPGDVRARIGRVYSWNVARNAAVEHQRAELAARFSAAGVRALVLKGADLHRLYPDRGARTLGDVDLVVPADQLAATQDALLAAGYGPRNRPPIDRTVPHLRHLLPFTRDGALPIEVHWALGEGNEVPPWQVGVWERATPEEGLLRMERLDALLFTCHHLAVHHLFETTNALAGLVDLALLLEHVDPDRIRGRAEEWGLVRATLVCLVLARELLAAPVSDALLASLHVPGWEVAAARSAWSIFHVGWAGQTRELLLPTAATLNPPPPATAVFGDRPLRAVLSYALSAAVPHLDDLLLEFPGLPRRRWAPLAYPRHWARVGYAHLGLLALARSAVREEYRARQHEQRLALSTFFGGG